MYGGVELLVLMFWWSEGLDSGRASMRLNWPLFEGDVDWQEQALEYFLNRIYRID